MRRYIAVLIISFALLIVLVPFPPSAQANTITVDGNCTLIDAIIAANTDAISGNCPAGSVGPDTIVLDVDVNLTAPYAGSTTIGGGQAGLPDITSEITIQGNLGDTISGNSTNFRVFYVSNTATLSLDGIEIRGGRLAPLTGDAMGAGIYTEGNLSIQDGLVTDNVLDGNGYNQGIGIYGTWTIPNSFQYPIPLSVIIRCLPENLQMVADYF